MINEWKEEKGNTVTVYDRYRFAVPVRGIVRETNHNSFKVDFFTNNPGGKNVNKHDGKWFLKGQCKVDIKADALLLYRKPEPLPPTHEEIMVAECKKPSCLGHLNCSDYFFYSSDKPFSMCINKNHRHTDCKYRKWYKAADIPPEAEK